MKPRRKPDWSKYGPDSKLRLYEAVALSCDIEPADIDLEKDRDDPDLELFWLRLAEAEQAIKDGKLPAEREARKPRVGRC
jgi:hypothetical protein